MGLLLFENGKENWWRVVVAFPLLFIGIQVVMFNRFFKYDSPKSYLLNSDKEHVHSYNKCIVLKSSQ